MIEPEEFYFVQTLQISSVRCCEDRPNENLEGEEKLDHRVTDDITERSETEEDVYDPCNVAGHYEEEYFVWVCGRVPDFVIGLEG